MLLPRAGRPQISPDRTCSIASAIVWYVASRRWNGPFDIPRCAPRERRSPKRQPAVPRALPRKKETGGATLCQRSLDRLATALGDHVTKTARVRAVQDQVWERAWLTGWHSMRFGRRLWVCPREAEAPEDSQAIVVRLDPGLAFGTGTHPTTALCLQILDSMSLEGRTVIDYGCGSGILGIAALKLGAAQVTAVDLDHQALLATRDNAIRNGVSSQMTVQGIEHDLHAAHCVMANILAGPLIELAPKLTAACEPGGHLLLSGLLKTQAYAVKAAYASGFDKVQVVERDEWCCIYARRVT